MASSPSKSNTTVRHNFDTPFTFAVVVEKVIGEVTVDPYGDTPYREVAYTLIAREGEEGRYSFPLEDGNTEYVTITRSKQGE